LCRGQHAQRGAGPPHSRQPRQRSALQCEPPSVGRRPTAGLALQSCCPHAAECPRSSAPLRPGVQNQNFGSRGSGCRIRLQRPAKYRLFSRPRECRAAPPRRCDDVPSRTSVANTWISAMPQSRRERRRRRLKPRANELLRAPLPKDLVNLDDRRSFLALEGVRRQGKFQRFPSEQH
jgi:hypothetical protein